ncbi:2,5-diketo-D-gluconate reductase B [Bradyrhizobium sp. F1.13.3]
MLFVETNGARIPAIGLGTWELSGRMCARVVEQALRLGYRHIDTAQVYENEREVGDGLRASGVRRDDIFLTTKVWTNHFAPHDLERSVKESLARMRLPSVDLLLLHWPNSHVPLEETLGALSHAKRMGLTRHIGVSNFTVALIEQAVALSPEPLACNQVEYHPYLDQAKVRRPAISTGSRWSPTARSPRGGSRPTRRSPRSGVFIARRRRRSACVGWCNRMSLRSRAPRASNACRKTSRSSISSFRTTRWPKSPRWPVPGAA